MQDGNRVLQLYNDVEPIYHKPHSKHQVHEIWTQGIFLQHNMLMPSIGWENMQLFIARAQEY